ncbi:hypothetical protein RRG08_038925 [Elysia crispata]|uniref:Uncharacterized protein n=1 Tax=Elysia crispata TaxID=231223 RepID=A0AAE1CU57_9GAST|nr:hypothetical protein RRG08_038925 [Elysia crispata]
MTNGRSSSRVPLKKKTGPLASVPQTGNQREPVVNNPGGGSVSQSAGNMCQARLDYSGMWFRGTRYVSVILLFNQSQE